MRSTVIKISANGKSGFFEERKCKEKDEAEVFIYFQNEKHIRHFKAANVIYNGKAVRVSPLCKEDDVPTTSDEAKAMICEWEDIGADTDVHSIEIT